MQSNRTAYVPIRMTPEERAALARVAEERSTSVSSIVRWVLRQTITHVEDAKAPPAGVEAIGGASLVSLR